MLSNLDRLHGLLNSAFAYSMSSSYLCDLTLVIIHHYFLHQVTVAGYALSGGGRGIERVDISPDGGKSWIEAHRYQKHDVPYVTSDISCDKWAWVLFEAVVNVKGDTVIVSKAVFFISFWFLLFFMLLIFPV